VFQFVVAAHLAMKEAVLAEVVADAAEALVSEEKYIVLLLNW
jgi:hypothetical protein